MSLQRIASCLALATSISSAVCAPGLSDLPKRQVLGAPQDGKFSLRAENHAPAATFTNGIRDLTAEQVAAAGHGLTKRGNTASVDVGSNWYIPVSVGTPPQDFLVLGDSGSPDLSLQSNLMPPAATGNSPLYKPGQSSTAKQMQGYTYDECFASGYCDNGVVYTDDFTVGGVTVTAMPMLVETNNTSPSNGVRTGTLGLNHDTSGQVSSPKKVPGWFASVKSQLASSVWTVNFDRHNNTGQFDFGHIDSSQYTGSIGYSGIVDDGGEWDVQFTGYQFGDKTYVEYDFKTTVDTGTGNANLPRNMVDAYFDLIPGSSFNSGYNTYEYPCSAQLLDFTFGLDNGAKATIPSEYLLWGSTDGGKTCVSQLIVGPSDGSGQSLWGQTFIEALFVVFDYDNNRVGFANKPLSDS